MPLSTVVDAVKNDSAKRDLQKEEAKEEVRDLQDEEKKAKQVIFKKKPETLNCDLRSHGEG